MSWAYLWAQQLDPWGRGPDQAVTPHTAKGTIAWKSLCDGDLIWQCTACTAVPGPKALT